MTLIFFYGNPSPDAHEMHLLEDHAAACDEAARSAIWVDGPVYTEEADRKRQQTWQAILDHRAGRM